MSRHSVLFNSYSIEGGVSVFTIYMMCKKCVKEEFPDRVSELVYKRLVGLVVDF